MVNGIPSGDDLNKLPAACLLAREFVESIQDMSQGDILMAIMFAIGDAAHRDRNPLMFYKLIAGLAYGAIEDQSRVESGQ